MKIIQGHSGSGKTKALINEVKKCIPTKILFLTFDDTEETLKFNKGLYHNVCVVKLTSLKFDKLVKLVLKYQNENGIKIKKILIDDIHNNLSNDRSNLVGSGLLYTLLDLLDFEKLYKINLVITCNSSYNLYNSLSKHNVEFQNLNSLT